MEFLGYEINQHEIKPLQNKVEAILKAPKRTSIEVISGTPKLLSEICTNDVCSPLSFI